MKYVKFVVTEIHEITDANSVIKDANRHRREHSYWPKRKITDVEDALRQLAELREIPGLTLVEGTSSVIEVAEEDIESTLPSGRDRT